MKPLVAMAACLLASATAFAQQKQAVTPATNQRAKKPAVGGLFLNERKQPVVNVKIFVYAADSSILASGYTDAEGRYETNAALPGKYEVKVVFPNNKNMLVSGVPIKSGITPLSMKGALPASDTTLTYAELMPQPEPKKKK